MAWLPLLLTPSYGADPCAVPASLPTSRGANIFNAGREADLGDALAEQLRQTQATIDDPGLTSFLQRIGDRITSRLSVQEPFHYELVDMPSPQAFTFPGGRIYVSRKIVAAAEDESELAAVIAHEIGHAVVHQASIDITKEMRVRLGVHEVTDRRDVFEKYNELIENRLRNPDKTVKLKEEKDQTAADQIGLFAMAAAGYDPEAMPRFFDRIAGTKSGAGSFLSGLFNYTTPDSKRLREMLRSLPAIPAACHGSDPVAGADDFKKWQGVVARYDVSRHTENLPGLISRVSLTPPLRSDLKRLRFSPDGRYILAQDDTGISVLTRQSFAFAFRIEAGYADPAQFSPDSKTISFSDPMSRVEIWDLATGSRRESRELLPDAPCALRRLASDARTFACYTGAGGLVLFDVPSGEELLRDQSFGVAPNVTWQVNTTPGQSVKYRGISPVDVAFSPDGRYLLASPSFSGNAPILFDVTKRAKAPLPFRARKFLSGAFTFLSNDRLLAVNPSDPKKSSILSFPDLKTIDSLELLRASYEPVTKGDYLLMRPFRDFAVAVIDVSRHEVRKASRTSAFDIYGDEYVVEKLFGELGLYGLEKNDLRASLQIPPGNFRHIRSLSISGDLKWLAVSGETHAKVWNLDTGQDIFNLPGFRSSWFSPADSLIVDLPKQKEHEREFFVLNPAAKNFEKGSEIKDVMATEYGPYLLVTKSADGDVYHRSSSGGYLMNVVLELHDALTPKLFWTKSFKEAPTVSFSHNEKRLVMGWSADTETGQAEIKADAAIHRRWNDLDDKQSAMVYDVMDADSGEVQSRLFVDTGNHSFSVQYSLLSGGFLVLADDQGQCIVYSLATGEIIGRVFGRVLASDPAGAEVAIENGQGAIGIYQLPSMRKLAQYQFAAYVTSVRFQADGKQLVAITENQQAVRVSVPSNALDPQRK